MTLTNQCPKCGHEHSTEADDQKSCEAAFKVWQKSHRCKGKLNAKGKDFKPGRA